MATLLFAPQPLAYARGSVRRRFGAANVRERMRNYSNRGPLCRMLWKILHEGVHYEERGPAVSAKSQRSRTARMIKELQKLGYHVNMATLLFAPQPLAYARGSVRRRFEPRTSERGCVITYDVLFSSWDWPGSWPRTPHAAPAWNAAPPASRTRRTRWPI